MNCAGRETHLHIRGNLEAYLNAKLGTGATSSYVSSSNGSDVKSVDEELLLWLAPELEDVDAFSELDELGAGPSSANSFCGTGRPCSSFVRRLLLCELRPEPEFFRNAAQLFATSSDTALVHAQCDNLLELVLCLYIRIRTLTIQRTLLIVMYITQSRAQSCELEMSSYWLQCRPRRRW